MEHLLKSGMILDGRYRIDRMLGEGGFGITYAAENVRIGLKVAIKEFFWHDHSTRNIDESPCVSFLRAEDRESFQAQKDRFLKEARILRDFSSLAGIVHILDYFEENNTAYIVMEYVERVTMNQYLAGHGGQMEAEAVLRRMLPVIDSLDQIHKSGVIHRDISPDNIMVTPEGELKIIDFGAARQILSDQTPMTAITKACYAPSEQYDKNGRQGPWTDVYALCATLYRCVTGAPPESAIQRMFLDELKAPSQLGIAIAPACEEVIMKGLQLRPEKRWQGMDELAKAVRDALPHPPPPPPPIPRGLIIGLLAGLLCVALALGIWGWRRYGETHKFRGIETERLRFQATKDTTAAEFAAAQGELRNCLEAFAGNDNYIMNVDGDSLWVTLPLDCFENRDIPVVLHEKFSGLVPGKDMHIWYDDKANWEDPAQSRFAGKNQVMPEALQGPQVIYQYIWQDSLTAGQRDNLIVDFKVRLDALDAPYAFGTAYGNEDALVYQIGLDRAGPFVENTIAFKYPLKIGDKFTSESIDYFDVLEAVEAGEGASCLNYTMSETDSYDKKKLSTYTRDMLDAGLDTLYLMDSEDHIIASTEITEPVTDGALVFNRFHVNGIESLDAQHRWLSEYFMTLIYRTNLPDNLICRSWEYIDGEGNRHLDDVKPPYGLDYLPAHGDHDQALHERLSALQQAYGYRLYESDTTFFVVMDPVPDANLAETVKTRLPELVKKLQIDHKLIWKTVIICLIDESDGNMLRFVIGSRYNYQFDQESGSFKTYWDTAAYGEHAVSLYRGLEDWFTTYDWDSLGLDKY